MAQTHHPSAPPDMLTNLPSELLLNVLSFLSAQSIIRLKRLNTTFSTFISHHEDAIFQPIIDRERHRLDLDIQRLNLQKYPFDIALRTFIMHYPNGQSCIRQHDIVTMAFNFLRVYPLTNVEHGTWVYYATLVLAIDHWLQYGCFPASIDREAALPVREAILDALDDTIPIDQRFQKLYACFEEPSATFSESEVIRIFEELRRAPMVRQSYVSDARHRRFTVAPNIVKLIGLPRHLPGVNIRLSVHARSQKRLRRCVRLVMLHRHQKRVVEWAAMMEVVGVELRTIK